jgi:hypothetical protein
MSVLNQIGKINIPKMEPVPWVAVKLASGKIVLRHPDEIKPQK